MRLVSAVILPSFIVLVLSVQPVQSISFDDVDSQPSNLRGSAGKQDVYAEDDALDPGTINTNDEERGKFFRSLGFGLSKKASKSVSQGADDIRALHNNPAQMRAPVENLPVRHYHDGRSPLQVNDNIARASAQKGDRVYNYDNSLYDESGYLKSPPREEFYSRPWQEEKAAEFFDSKPTYRYF